MVHTAAGAAASRGCRSGSGKAEGSSGSPSSVKTDVPWRHYCTAAELQLTACAEPCIVWPSRQGLGNVYWGRARPVEIRAVGPIAIHAEKVETNQQLKAEGTQLWDDGPIFTKTGDWQRQSAGGG